MAPCKGYATLGFFHASRPDSPNDKPRFSSSSRPVLPSPPCFPLGQSSQAASGPASFSMHKVQPIATEHVSTHAVMARDTGPPIRDALTPELVSLILLGFLALCYLRRWKQRTSMLTSCQCWVQTGHEGTSAMSAETMSSLFPDRPIRPLPKRRLRERLSPDVADSIQYPPVAPGSPALFYYPYGIQEDKTACHHTTARDRNSDSVARHPRRNGSVGVQEEDLASRRIASGRPSQDLTIRSGRMPGKMDVGRQSFSHAPQSTASSPDGYDSFENTNNKKKRKIPTVADTVPNGNHALGHMTATSIMPGKSNKDVADGPASPMAPYNGAHGTATGAQNVPGPGRGRYGRVRNGRSPLRALSDSTNNHAGRNGKMRPVQWSSPASKALPPLRFVFFPCFPPLPNTRQQVILQHLHTALFCST